MKIIEKLRNSSFWRSVITLSAGQVIGQAITLLTIPIVSRLYSNEEYGEFGIITSTATIIVGMIGLGLGSLIMVAKNDEDAGRIVRVTYFLQVVLAGIICAGMLILLPIKKFYETSVSYPVSLLMMFAYITGATLVYLLNIHINRLKKNKALFFNPMIMATCTIVITIPFGLFKFGFIGLMAANIVAFFVSSVHMLRYDNPFRSRLKFKDIPDVFREGKSLVLFQYPANLMGTVSAQLPNQMLSNSFGNAALGSFAMCNKLFNFPMNLIATPIQTVYFRTASEKYRKNENIAPLTYSLVTKICYISVLPVLLVVLFGRQIFAFVLGSGWAEAGTIASILILQYVLTFCNNCITYCRVSIGKQKWNLYASIIQLILIFTSLYTGYEITHTLTGVLLFYGIFNAIWQIINIEISFICLKQFYIRWLIFSSIYMGIGFACFFIINSHIL